MAHAELVYMFMHKQSLNTDLLKQIEVRTRLHDAPVFKTYKPNNEKACQNVMYRGAILGTCCHHRIEIVILILLKTKLSVIN